MYFPAQLKSKERKYKYIKKRIDKFNTILENQIKEKACAKRRQKNNRQQREACRRFMVHPTGFEPVAF